MYLISTTTARILQLSTSINASLTLFRRVASPIRMGGGGVLKCQLHKSTVLKAGDVVPGKFFNFKVSETLPRAYLAWLFGDLYATDLIYFMP